MSDIISLNPFEAVFYLRFLQITEGKETPADFGNLEELMSEYYIKTGKISEKEYNEIVNSRRNLYEEARKRIGRYRVGYDSFSSIEYATILK